MLNKIELIDNVEVFSKFLEKYKGFRKLPEQYKNIKFIKLYMKIYNYILSIPKEKIVLSDIVKNHLYFKYSLKYINYFIEVKDFYHWKYRIYSLLTEKLDAISYRKYNLLYGSKWEKFYNKYQEKFKTTCMKKYGVEHPSQSKEVQEQIKSTNLERYGKEYVSQVKEIQDRMKATNLEKYGKEYYIQTEEYKEKYKTTCLERYGYEYSLQSKEIQEQIKSTNLERYGVEYIFQRSEVRNSKNNSHSKIADEMCEYIDKYFGYPEDSYYALKNKEFSLRTENNSIRYYDYVNTKYKFIVEFQGLYFHGLLEGQKDVRGISVEEIHKRDEEKKLLAENNGYKVFYVYENEYSNNKSKCLENLLKEIKNYVHSLENRI